MLYTFCVLVLRPSTLLMKSNYLLKKNWDMIGSFDECRKGIVGLVLMQINCMH